VPVDVVVEEVMVEEEEVEEAAEACSALPD
jgi:hypothetical protein